MATAAVFFICIALAHSLCLERFFKNRMLKIDVVTILIRLDHKVDTLHRLPAGRDLELKNETIFKPVDRWRLHTLQRSSFIERFVVRIHQSLDCFGDQNPKSVNQIVRHQIHAEYHSMSSFLTDADRRPPF